MTLELGHGHGSARIALSAITKATFVASFLISFPVPINLSPIAKDGMHPSTSERKLIIHHKAHRLKSKAPVFLPPRINLLPMTRRNDQRTLL